HLKILAASRGGDIPRLCPHVEDDALLQPGNKEVSTLVDNLILNTGQPVEDDGSVSTSHIVHGLLEESHANGGRHSHPVSEVESLRHCDNRLCLRGRLFEDE